MKTYVRTRKPKLIIFKRRHNRAYYKGAIIAIQALLDTKQQHEGPEDDVTWDMLYKFRDENQEAYDEV